MKRFSILLITLCAAGISVAQTPVRMTLDQCVAAACDHNRRLAAADKRLEASRYDMLAMRSNFLPSISATATAFYSGANGALDIPGGMLPVFGADGAPTGASAYFPGVQIDYRLGWLYGGGVMLQQPVYMGGKVRTGWKMARTGYDLTRQYRRLTEEEVIVETSRAWADVVRTRELKQVAERYHELLARLKRNVESAYRQGMKPQSDLLRVEVKYNESLLNLRRAENGLRLATMNLCHLTGQPLTTALEVADDLPAMPEAVPAADIESRPEYGMLAGKSELARHEVRLAQSERLPQVALVGGYGYMHGVQVNEGYLLNGANFAAGVQVSIPIFHFGGRTNKIRSAKARYEQTVLEQQETNDRMWLEMTRAANNLDEANLEMRLAESSLDSANENLRANERRYEAGTASLSDYLEAQVMWQDAHHTWVEARVNGYLRLLEYRKAAGLTTR